MSAFSPAPQGPPCVPPGRRYTARHPRGERAVTVTPDEPEELRPTQLVERTRAALYHVLATADPLADVYPDRIMAAFVGHYFTALGPAIGRYREPADQDRFAREEAARFLALLAQAERERATRLEEPYLRLVPLPGDSEADG